MQNREILEPLYDGCKGFLRAHIWNTPCTSERHVIKSDVFEQVGQRWILGITTVMD